MGLGYTWYLWCYLYQASVSVRAIEGCREFLLSVLRKFDSISSPAPFPKQAPSPEPQELRWLSAAVLTAARHALSGLCLPKGPLGRSTCVIPGPTDPPGEQSFPSSFLSQLPSALFSLPAFSLQLAKVTSFQPKDEFFLGQFGYGCISCVLKHFGFE